MIERCKSAQLELLAATTIEARVTPTRNPTTIEATTSLRLHVPCRIPRDTNSDAGPGVRGSTELPIGNDVAKTVGVTDPTEHHVNGPVARLVGAWCERRALAPLATLLPSYVSNNGLTDGLGRAAQRALHPARFAWPTIRRTRRDRAAGRARRADGVPHRAADRHATQLDRRPARTR